MTMSKSLPLSEPQFPNLADGMNYFCIPGLWLGVGEMRYVKCLEQHLAHSVCSISAHCKHPDISLSFLPHIQSITKLTSPSPLLSPKYQFHPLLSISTSMATCSTLSPGQLHLLPYRPLCSRFPSASNLFSTQQQQRPG